MKLSKLMALYEKELIANLSYSADGMGPTKAAVVAENFDDLKEFLTAKESDFKEIKNRKGKCILSDGNIQKIMQVKKVIPLEFDVRLAWLYKLSLDFIHSQVEMVKSINLDNLDINPILVEALDLREPKDMLSFTMYQTVTRSVVTAWGTTVEKMVKYSGCERNDSRSQELKGMNFDLKKCFGGKEYYIQIKSGPNTMNVGMVQSLNATIKRLPKGKKAFLGMTYGTRQRISAQIMGNLTDPQTQTKVGRELWDFISEEKDFYKKVLATTSVATAGVLSENFIDLIDAQIDILVEQWNNKFRDKTLEQALENYI